MGHLISFFSRIDAAVQRRFDSVCFFLMRRFGVRKSSIRYAIFTLLIVAVVCGLSTQMRYGVASAPRIFIDGFFILVLLLNQHFTARYDREAEAKPGTVSAADLQTGAGAWKLGLIVLLVNDLLKFRYPPSKYVGAGLTEGQHVFPTFCDVLIWLSCFLEVYLRKTPLNPPPEKAREPVLAPQPAPAKL